MIVSDGGRTGSSQKPLRRNGRIIRFPSRSRRTGCSARTMRCRAAGATIPIPRPEYSPARGRSACASRLFRIRVLRVFPYSFPFHRAESDNFSPGRTDKPHRRLRRLYAPYKSRANLPPRRTQSSPYSAKA